MTSAGTVTVDFAAEVAKFNAQLKTVQQAVGSLQKQFDTFGSFVKKGLDVLSGAALAGLAKAAISAADALGDAAARMGTTVETLSKLKFAARENDVQFASLEVAIRKFQDTMSEARAGTSAAVQTFAELGISAERLTGLGLDEQLGLIADRFREIRDPADQVRIAIDLFGRAGNELIPLLNKGSAGLQELMQRAEELGVVLDTKTAEAVDRATKRLETFRDVITVVAAKAVEGWDLILNGAPTEQLKVDNRLRVVQEQLKTFDEIIRNNPETIQFDRAFREMVEALREEEKRLSATQRQQLNLENDNIARLKVLQDALASIKLDPGQTPKFSVAPSDEELKKQQDAAFNSYVFQLQEQHAQDELFAGLTLDLKQQVIDEGLRMTEQGIRQEIAFQEDRFRQQAQVEQAILNLKQSALNAGLGLLQALATKSKAAAVALIAINKALAIAQVIQNTAVAVMKALAIYGPTPQGFAAAAGAKALGALQIALIAATGAIEIGNVLSGGPTLGSPVNPIFTSNNTEANASLPGATSQQVTQVIIQGDVFSSEQTAEWLIEQLQDAINGRDVVIIQPGSRQGQEIAGG